MDSDPVRRFFERATLLVTLVGLVTCATNSVRRFPLRDPVWVDPDANPVSSKPAKRTTRGYALAADATVLRPISRALTLPLPSPARNVNSLDEVPDSSWFTNRIGRHPMTPAEVARGACGEGPVLDPARGPWIIASGKTDGSHPGVVIKAPDGTRYLLKVDGALMSERATAADVVGSKIYYAAGYFTPCDQIVTFTDDVLQLGPSAKSKDRYGHDQPLTSADLGRILAAAWRGSDGRLRASASRYLSGEPLGPFSYEGVRSDDPNDIVPHEQRRELRGSKLFAAWIHHWDASENNTLDTWVNESGRHFVRHHILDWGDALGDIWTWTWKRFNPRVGTGRTGYFDLDYALVDLVTLGLTPRPWYHVPQPPQPETFGYFDTASFSPATWRGTYANPAFLEMTLPDALWATRIIARFTDADLAAIVAEARLADAGATAFLTTTLIKRRDIILREYLTQGSPLDRFEVSAPTPMQPQSLCFEDLALSTHVASPASTMYRVHLHGGANLDELLGWRQLRPDPRHPERTCVALPLGPTRPALLAGPGAPDDHPLRFAVMEIYSNQSPSLQATAFVRVHLVDLGSDRGFRIVGLERPTGVQDPP